MYLFNTSNIVKTMFACILRILVNITQIVTQTKIAKSFNIHSYVIIYFCLIVILL